jgi:hypothetical protein
LARHLGAPRWGAFLVALGYAFCGFYTAHAEHTTVLYSFSFVPWFMQQSFSTPWGSRCTNNNQLAAKVRLMKNFGFCGYDNVIYIGTNGK